MTLLSKHLALSVQMKMFGQIKPETAGNHILYRLPNGEMPNVTAIVTSICVCNISNDKQEFSIFLDNTGKTFDNSTAIFYKTVVERGDTKMLSGLWFMNNHEGHLAIGTSEGNALTITVHGIELS